MSKIFHIIALLLLLVLPIGSTVAHAQSRVDAITAEYDRMESESRRKLSEIDRQITETQNKIAALLADPMHSETILMQEEKWLEVLKGDRISEANHLAGIQQNRSRAIQNEKNLENAVKKAVQKAREDKQKQEQLKARQAKIEAQKEAEYAAKEAKRKQQQAEEDRRRAEFKAKQEAEYQANYDKAVKEFDSKGSLEKSYNYIDNCVESMNGISNDVMNIGMSGSIQSQQGFTTASAANVKRTGNTARSRSLKSIIPKKSVKAQPVNAGYLDYNSIPFATMKADAVPYSEWGKQTAQTYILTEDLNVPEPSQLPQMTRRWEGDWDVIHSRISDNLLPQIKASIFFSNDGEIPPLYYSKKADKYIAELNDGKTIVALSADGKTLDFLKWTDTNDTNLLENMGKAKLSANAGSIGLDVGSKGVSYKNKIIKIENKSYNKVSLGTSISDSKDFGEDESLKKKDTDKDKEDKGFLSVPEIGLEGKFTLYENSSQIERKRFYFGENVAKGYQWSLKAGLDVSSKVGASQKSASVSASATSMEGDFGGQLIIPVFNGYVFSEAKINGAAGYKFKRKSKKGGKEIDMSSSSSLKQLPLSIGYEVKALKYYSKDTINKAMPWRK